MGGYGRLRGELVKFWDKDDYKYEIFSILSIAHAWTSVILAGKRGSRLHPSTGFLRECRSGGNKLSNVNILLSGEGLTSFSVNNRPNFSGEKKLKEAFLGVFFVVVFWEHE